MYHQSNGLGCLGDCSGCGKACPFRSVTHAPRNIIMRRANGANMYHQFLSQDDQEVPAEAAPPGFQWVIDESGSYLAPISQAAPVETTILPTTLIPPTPVSIAPSAAAPSGVALPTTAAPTAPAAASGIQQLLNALSPAPTVTPTGAAVPTASTFDYWLSQTTGGVSNTTIFWGAILVGGALLIVNVFKRKR